MHRFGVTCVTIQVILAVCGASRTCYEESYNHLGWKKHLKINKSRAGTHPIAQGAQKAHSFCHTNMSCTSRQCVLQPPLTAFCCSLLTFPLLRGHSPSGVLPGCSPLSCPHSDTGHRCAPEHLLPCGSFTHLPKILSPCAP